MKRLYAIGIDFGTSNSCICQACYIRGDDGALDPTPLKRPEPVIINGSDTVPSAVFLGTEDEAPVYGGIAEEKSLFYPELTCVNFKMQLGAAGEDGKQAFEQTRDFLRFLKEELGKTVPFDAGEDEAEFATCIGHPVQWSAEQRRLTLQAAVEAGFPNAAIEDETSAALYSHLCESSLLLEPENSARILVIDMGGGTTDFAFVEVPSEIEKAPMATPLDPSRIVTPWEKDQHTYGGRDLDQILLKHIATPWGYCSRSREWAFLLRETRRFKEQFSRAMTAGKKEYRANWMIDGLAREVKLSRKDFEQLARPYINHLPRLIEGALSIEGIRPEQVTAIILTGGSSRWYWVEDAIKKVLPHINQERETLIRRPDPEQSVARGLAYRWMIETLGGRPRPRRRAAHGIWIASPEPAAETAATLPPSIPSGIPIPLGTPEDPLVVMDRGQLLPFHTPGPARLVIQKMDVDVSRASLRLKLYTGSSKAARYELLDQVATFDRSFWESLLKKISKVLPWSTSFDNDQYDIEVLCAVDENELFTGKVTITRYYRGRPAQQQIQMLQMESQANA
ncbi:MAG TPA: Hsp70 family protein [Armatimonadota bacterium]|nr:Hsp70 family protein [Armatimonadota bacterium]